MPCNNPFLQHDHFHHHVLDPWTFYLDNSTTLHRNSRSYQPSTALLLTIRGQTPPSALLLAPFCPSSILHPSTNTHHSISSPQSSSFHDFINSSSGTFYSTTLGPSSSSLLLIPTILVLPVVLLPGQLHNSTLEVLVLPILDGSNT